MACYVEIALPFFYISHRLHGVTPHDTAFFVVVIVRTPNAVKLFKLSNQFTDASNSTLHVTDQPLRGRCDIYLCITG
jgi:hypothetical protein